jgi:antitoxin (DNA-binding transcriptional repressor) of toxin-antitoxin stability system
VTLRIDISEVGDRIEEALASAAAGEEVVLERDGRPIAEIRPSAVKPGGLRAMFDERERTAPRGPKALEEWEDFERDLKFAKAMLNSPVETEIHSAGSSSIYARNGVAPLTIVVDTSVVIDLEHRRLAGEEVAHLLPSDGVLAAISIAEIWLESTGRIRHG